MKSTFCKYNFRTVFCRKLLGRSTQFIHHCINAEHLISNANQKRFLKGLTKPIFSITISFNFMGGRVIEE